MRPLFEFIKIYKFVIYFVGQNYRYLLPHTKVLLARERKKRGERDRSKKREMTTEREK